MQDVVVIGAGIIGVSAARELSKYQLDVLVVERCSDLSEGTTKANSGIVHAGYDCEPGTNKAYFNVRGSQLYEQWSKDLDFPYRQNGSLVLAFAETQTDALFELMEKGKKNGVQNLSIINREEILNMEPNINPDVVKALYVPAGGITSPYKACIAIAENAAVNGVKFQFDTEVTAISKEQDQDGFFYKVQTSQGEICSRTVVNAAGLYSDQMNNFVSEQKYLITPRKGEYLLFDKSLKGYVDKTIFQLPEKYGKGVLVTPTMDGNLMIGPSAEDILDKEDTATHAETIDHILVKAKLSVPVIPMNQIITSFTGLRAHNEENHDFIVAKAKGAPGFINAIGLESPGLSAAPAIGEYITQIICEILHPQSNLDFVKTRKGITAFQKLDIDSQNELIRQNSAYGKIVCRCESITEGEIIEAIHRPLGAITLDGIKRRVRAGFGRCQGGFCSAKIIEIIAREKGIKVSEVTKSGGDSHLVLKE